MVKIIKIFGDKYGIRKTYDVDGFVIGRYEFDVHNENEDLLCQFVGNKINELRQYVKINFYKNYEGTYSHYK